jgi:hypothetical protein
MTLPERIRPTGRFYRRSLKDAARSADVDPVPTRRWLDEIAIPRDG